MNGSSMFGTHWFGYDKSEVNQRINQFESRIHQLEEALQEARAHIRGLEAQMEEYEVRVASLRRDRQAASSGSSEFQQSVTVVLGPATTFAKVADVADALEAAECLSIRFRIFRDGFYRVDAMTSDVQSVVAWFEQHPGTRRINVDSETIHVLLK